MSRPVRALIVDDEPMARRLLGNLLAKEADIEVVGTCRHGAEAVHWLGQNTADLLFLDVQMPGMDGFELLAALPSPPAVIFVTAHDTFAVRAFEAEAWDYLLKPFDEERLRQTLARVRKRLAPSRSTSSPSTGAPFASLPRTSLSTPRRMTISQGRGRVTLDVAAVRFIRAEGNYARFFLNETSYLSRIALSELETQLGGPPFVRIHRSIILNVDYLRRIDPHGHGDLRLTLDDGHQLTLSRRFRQRFEAVVPSLP